MSVPNSFAIFNTSPDFHLDLLSQLLRVNLDCLEKMVSMQFFPLKELIERTSLLSLDDSGQSRAWWAAVGYSSIEYWKTYTLDSLEYQHRVLQALAQHSTK